MTAAPRQQEAGAWIVGLDDSECATHALRWAVAQQSVASTAARATQLRLVTSWQVPLYGPYPGAGPATTTPHDNDAIRANATAQLAEIVEATAPLVDVHVEGIVSHGAASAALLDASEHAALLIVGSRGRGGFTRLLLGSTSTQCATHAVVPTVVVPRAAEIRPIGHITVGIDGSPNSIAALEWALDFAPTGATVTAMSAWDASPLAVGSDQFFFPEACDLAQERFDHMIDGVEAEADGDRQLTIERRFVSASPKAALRDASEATDLLVVGARGHGSVGAALLGSVSTWLLHHVAVPVAVVPEPAR